VQLVDGRIVYSATDLVGFSECTHLTNLERAALGGFLKRPMRADPVLDRIVQRGLEHEARFLNDLAAEGIAAVNLEPDKTLLPSERIARGRNATLQAMQDGAQVIYQAVLFDGRKLGYADFLRRVAEPSELGGWSYEVWDTKLARHAKASAVLQISMYSQMVGAIQGKLPEQMHLALGGVQRETVSFRVKDYAAYYRLVAREFEELLDSGATFPVPSEPEPVEHCDVCRWALECKQQWRSQDDLSLVANVSSRQRHALQAIGVTTRTALAEPPSPLPDRLDGAGREALMRIQAQANIQVRGERQQRVISELIPPTDRSGELALDTGLLMLPEPSPGDLFFDIEGDPFFGSQEVDGIDYLFGVIEPGLPTDDGQPMFHAFWAVDDDTVTTAGERRAFEGFIDLVMDRMAADPNLHVYHYAPYEPTAVKRLAGRYGTREAEVDRLLRGGVFVDLYRATRQGIRASVESYSIKKLEPLYGFNRDIDLRDAGTSIVEFETWLELGQGDAAERTRLLREIEGYNRDDCISTLLLRNWLEQQRSALQTLLGMPLPRPTMAAPETTDDSDAQKAVQLLVDQLVDGLPDEPSEMDEKQHGRWLLAQMLNWHRREDKSFWWRYFYLISLTDEERLEEPDALALLTLIDVRPDPAPRSRSNIYRFSFPPQEHKIKMGSGPRNPATGKGTGTVVGLDDIAGAIELKIGNTQPVPALTSLIPYEYIDPKVKRESLVRLAQWAIQNGLDSPGDFRAARDLLVRRYPAAGQSPGAALASPGEDAQDAARRLVLTLDQGFLAIQGPPGSGKSSVGAEMIVDLVAAGKTVGVTANSHKVIGELLEKTAVAARKRGEAVRIGQVAGNSEPTFRDAVHLKSNDAARDGIDEGTLDVVGGTGWLWSREEMLRSVDVLFIDEAGQMSLADALAASLCATNLVLLGDPQQLDQPLQGVHPPGAERSALAHILHLEYVMPENLGIFLDGTWRLHPGITEYTSEVFYDHRLHSHPGREVLTLNGASPLTGTGIRFLPVQHTGNASDSQEEADAILEHLQRLLASKATWTNANGETKPVTDREVLLITPYNAQVAELSKKLPGLRIGTVDKFQGQEAPISIYSMATSSADEAPRGLEFLYSLNRLNVATSRAQCLAVVVASPGLLHVRCQTPRQMQLVNALARLIEFAAHTL